MIQVVRHRVDRTRSSTTREIQTACPTTTSNKSSLHAIKSRSKLSNSINRSSLRMRTPQETLKNTITLNSPLLRQTTSSYHLPTGRTRLKTTSSPTWMHQKTTSITKATTLLLSIKFRKPLKLRSFSAVAWKISNINRTTVSKQRQLYCCLKV